MSPERPQACEPHTLDTHTDTAHRQVTVTQPPSAIHLQRLATRPHSGSGAQRSGTSHTSDAHSSHRHTRHWSLHPPSFLVLPRHTAVSTTSTTDRSNVPQSPTPTHTAQVHSGPRATGPSPPHPPTRTPPREHTLAHAATDATPLGGQERAPRPTTRPKGPRAWLVAATLVPTHLPSRPGRSARRARTATRRAWRRPCSWTTPSRRPSFPPGRARCPSALGQGPRPP